MGVNSKITTADTGLWFFSPLCALTTSSLSLVGKTSDLLYTAYTNSNIGTVTFTPGVITTTVSSRTSAIVGKVGNYTITFKTQSRVPNGKPINFKIPISQMVYNAGTTSCKLGTGASGSCSNIASSDPLYSNFSITQWCNPSGICPKASEMTILFIDAQNPGWITSPDTSSVQIFTTNTINSVNCNID